MKSKMVLVVVVALMFFGGSSFAEDKELFDRFFSKSHSATDFIYVTDANGCIFSLFDDGCGLRFVQLLDKKSNPVCRKTTGRE